ncbi:glutamate racemase [Ulvibacter litoralis]|uniref:Glutamate racemase n=1 Tax=Ulvibacter litoralis TaxID=227084 RepID=A0A1G7J890_9FLAO|nr:glutamate racemase [Ulvibacter litoralis]GHC64305.1 glutamate racemase [Ulvibacter litoralis]SDF21093.1 glutamate racemase [Ulvibacter litoralis]
MKNNAAIGIFDSGVGGSSIWQEIHKLLPFENTIYLADSKNAPYGHKSKEEITALSVKNVERLISLGCKIIVVACNTATTNAISQLRATYSIPIIGIEPAIKPAALKTTSKSIGILATKGTLSSLLFHKTAMEHTKDIKMLEIVGEGLVPLIEKGNLEGPEMVNLLQKYVTPMIEADIDYLVLGCSHYPYLIPLLRKMLPPHIQIIDSGEAVARHTQYTLASIDLLRKETSPPKLQFFTNNTTEALEFLLQDYSEEISVEKKDF